MSQVNISLAKSIHDDLERTLKDNLGIKSISLATVDGFHLSRCSIGEHILAQDALSAVSSTMCAMSVSCSKQMMSGNFNLTTVETSAGNILFLGLRCSGYSCVLSIAADSRISLGQLRFIAKRLSEDLVQYQRVKPSD